MHKWKEKLFVVAMSVFLVSGTLGGCSGAESANVEALNEEKNTEITDETAASSTNSTVMEQDTQVVVSEHPWFLEDGIRKVVLVENGEEIFCLSNEPADYKMSFDYWEILNPYDETVTVNTEIMYELFGVLCGLDFQTPVTVDGDTDTGILDSNTTITVDFVDTADASEAKNTAYADTTATILLGNEDGEGNRFAAIQGFEDQIYKISSDTIDSVYNLDPFSYILKIPVLVNIDTVERVEIETEKKTYEMKVDSAEGEYALDGEAVEKETFTGMYQAICGIMLEAEADPDKADDSSQEKLSVTFYRNQDEYPELQVKYFAYDAEHDLVQVNGNAYFLVNAEEVEQLITLAEETF